MAVFGTQAFSGTKMGHIANSTTQVRINKSGISQQDNAAISCHKNLENKLSTYVLAACLPFPIAAPKYL